MIGDRIEPSGRPEAGPSPVSLWVPARKFPESYPGACPPSHYLLFRGSVYPVVESSQPHRYEVVLDSGPVPVDEFLARAGLPLTDDRFPVLAYGANRNPATLETKLLAYPQVTASPDRCVLVLAATLHDADVVACGLLGQGYFYGELLVGSAFSAGVHLDARVLLVDESGLRALNDSEGLRHDTYSAAHVPGVVVSGSPGTIAPLGYIANACAWSSPVSGGPVGYSSVPATGRRILGLTARQIMDHALDALDLRAAVSAATSLDPGETLAGELAKYLNGQWWYRFHTGDAPIVGYSRVLADFDAATSATPLEARSLDYLAARGYVLPVEEAYHPDASLTFERLRRTPPSLCGRSRTLCAPLTDAGGGT